MFCCHAYVPPNRSLTYNESFRYNIVKVIDGKLVDGNFAIRSNVSFTKQANNLGLITQDMLAIDGTIFSAERLYIENVYVFVSLTKICDFIQIEQPNYLK